MRKKKAAGILLAILLVVGLPACVSTPDISQDIPQSSISTATSSVTNLAMPSESSKFEEPILFSSDENIPMPTGDKWYDWDNIGTYPNDLYFGHAVTGDEHYLYYTDNIWDGDELKGFMLYRCDLDGRNPLLLDKVNGPQWNRNVNCYKEYVYYETPNGIFKIKNNGTDKTQLTKQAVSNMLVADGEVLYVLKGALYENDENGTHKIGNTDALGLENFLSYDKGALYNGIHTTENGDTEIKAYDISKGKNKTLIEDLFQYDSGMIADQGKLYYLFSKDLLYDEPYIMTYDTATGEESRLTKIVTSGDDNGVPSDNLVRFDRYLIYISHDDNRDIVWGYDLHTDKTYKLADIHSDDNYYYMTVTPKYLYINNERLVFKDGHAGLQRLISDIV